MSSSINVNITALTTQRYLATSQSALAISMQRLSSGLRINSAKDDAAGLAIGSNMTTLIRCQTVAMRNANDEISLSQTKEGALGKMGDLLQRMRELAVQAPNATNSDNDRAYLNTEFVQMQDELQRIRKGTSFNGTKVFADNALDPALPNCTLTGTKTTVSAGVNDTLQVTLNGLSANVTLAAGSYTQTALAAALQSAINSKSTFVSAGSSVSASIVNGALSLVSTRQGAGSGVSLAGTATSALFGATAASSSGQPLAGTIDGVAAIVSGSTLTGAPATTAAGLTVTALAGTTTGSYTLNVDQLATSGSWLGGTLGDPSFNPTLITAGVNDNLQVTLDGQSASLTLAEGSYSPEELATVVQNAINGNSTFVSAGSSVSASIVNGALRLVSTRQGVGSVISLDGTAKATLSTGYLLPTTAEIFPGHSAALGWPASWQGGILPADPITIVAGANDSMQVTLDGLSASVTLSAGIYTVDELASALQSAINSNSTFINAGSSVTARKCNSFMGSVSYNGLILESARTGGGSNVSLTGASFFTEATRATMSWGTDVIGAINGVALDGFRFDLWGAPGTAFEGFGVWTDIQTPVGSYAINLTQVNTPGSWLGQTLPGTIDLPALSNRVLQINLYDWNGAVTLAAGSYTPQTLASEVQAAINLAYMGAGHSYDAVSASIVNGALSLATTSIGPSRYIDLAGTVANTLAGGTGVATTTNGTYLAGTINGYDASGSTQYLRSAAIPGLCFLPPNYGRAGLGSYVVSISQPPTSGSWLGSALPNTTTITAGVNDTLEALISGLSRNATLAPGTYTRDGLAAAVNNAFGIPALASIENGALKLTATGTPGSDSHVVLTGGTAWNTLVGGSVTEATSSSGQNASGTINGVAAVASGQTFSLATGLTAKVSSGVGSHVINVSQLATQGSWLAAGLPGNTTSVLDQIDAALQQVNTEMVVQGATQNQLSSVITNLQTSNENLMEARSRIMDTDYAAETANLARHQIMQQAGMAMLAQANQSPKDVLALLR